ncbi:PIG-L deacetylase family protein [Rhodopila sp.]|uniref:PIG-L deacetylase family protein n=1 Tax=Rhodopila sp. TaxID=2480087 RepID=UPI003D11C4A4
MSTAGECQSAWRGLKLGSLDDVIGSGTCLILAPHPDDESLGCGGLIAMCAAAGRMPLVVVLTDGAGSHPNSRDFPPDRLRALRAREVLEATACLGLAPDRLVLLRQPDTAAPHDGPGFAAVVARLVGLIRREPTFTAILAPWRHDPHCDHTAASLIAAAVAECSGIKHLAFPVWGWTLPPETPIPGAPAVGCRLDISLFLGAKRAALKAHRSQYGGLITDDPAGFQLPHTLLSVFDTAFETFIRP